MPYLQACLKAVFNEIGADDEVVVVDNASSDGSAELVQVRWPGVKLICNTSNLGFAAACNQGAGLARGEVLVFLNQDTCVQPGWLNGLLKPLEADPSVGLVTSKVLLMKNPEQIQMCGQELHFTGFVIARGFLSPTEDYRKAEQVGAISGASFAIRRREWEQLGGFDAILFMYYEETDLSWRAMMAGYTCLYSPDSMILHDYVSGNSAIALTYSVRNRMVLMLKNWKGVTLLLLLPSIFLAELIDWAYMGLVGWAGISAKARSFIWLARNFTLVIRSRAEVQAGRKEPDWVVLKACSARLSPKVRTGGWIGRMLIGICNFWFSIHYNGVLYIAQRLNI